jgi:uncharacterized protein YdhG (YjbR/CyaY superfamily)
MTDTKSAGAAARDEKAKVFTDYERAAIVDRAEEQKAETRRGRRGDKEAGESDVLAKIAELPESDRLIATRLHAIIKDTAPTLSPKTWYGMPAYARDGKVVCWFQAAQKFNTRYATFGFNDSANLDDGDVWPVTYAIKELTDAEAARIAELVLKAAS